MYSYKKNGVLLESDTDEFGGVVYFCSRGKRHSVFSAARIKEMGFVWPDDVIKVSNNILAAFEPAGHVPRQYKQTGFSEEIKNSIEMREYMGSQIHGFGLEVGAGASPFPVPLECSVLYGDYFPHERLIQELYPGQRAESLVIPDIITELETLSGVANESLDFIIACHVIEHTKNPIGAIVESYKRLKKGGKLLLCIPDKERTFDSNRPLTPLNHLIEDYQKPDRGRDYEHYEEFYRLSFPIENRELYKQEVRRRYDEQYAIHYHVWNHDSFKEMLEWTSNNVCNWGDIWTHKAMNDCKVDIEFYSLLTK